MSPVFRQRLGVPDPAPAMKQREIEKAANGALTRCRASFDQPRFCDCFVAAGRREELDVADGGALAADMFAVVAVARTKPGLAAAVRSCARAL